MQGFVTLRLINRAWSITLLLVMLHVKEPQHGPISEAHRAGLWAMQGISEL